MKPIKVAHITTVDISLRYLLLNQLRSIAADGYEVVGISAPGPEVPIVEAAGIRHIPVAMTRSLTPFADLVSLWKLFLIMRRERFAIVHTHTPKPGLLGQIAARMAGVPVVINTLHGFYFHDAMHPLKRRFYITTEKIAARFSSVILSQNSEDIRTAIQVGICKAEKIKFLGNGIDVTRFDREAVDQAVLKGLRSELGLAEGAPVIGFVGRLVQEKGILELLQAMQTVLKQFPNARLLLIGPVDHEKADALTPAVASEYDLADACVFTGTRADMPELYALIDVFVLPSHREGFPRSPMEASAMSVPNVVTDIRGCREAVENDVNGILVPLKDPPSIAVAVIDLLAHPDKALQMGQRGRQMAEERFDERIVFDKVKAEYAARTKQVA